MRVEDTVLSQGAHVTRGVRHIPETLPALQSRPAPRNTVSLGKIRLLGGMHTECNAQLLDETIVIRKVHFTRMLSPVATLFFYRDRHRFLP